MADVPHHRHNLPAPVSRFIGREQELREITQHVSDHRLVTLTGAGGAGKTRLALQVAADELAHFADGVWLMELAPLSRAELVLETIAKVLALPETADPPLAERLCASLSAKHLLLVVDNCEHVLDECARVLAHLLSCCPHLVVLATSREPLVIDGEVVARVPALRLPDLAAPLDPGHLLDYDAIRLFVERAQAAEPSFRFTKVTAGAVVEICRRLDGIPLALELAAVRVRGMGVAYLAARLDQRFQLLTQGERTALPRQQTLHAMIEWSVRLLPEGEQVLLRRLGVFVGGFALEAAESVCVGAYGGQNGQKILSPERVLPHLLHLVNTSLVQYDQEQGRYRLLETIRLFCLERLAEAGETQYVSLQHYAWYLQLAEDGAALLVGPGQEAWFTRLEQEHDNLRAALTWWLEQAEQTGDTGAAERALRLCVALQEFWKNRGYFREGIAFLERALARRAGVVSGVQARALCALGLLLFLRLNKHDAWEGLAHEALSLARQAGDANTSADALTLLAAAVFGRGQLDLASAYGEEALALWQQAGNAWRRADWLIDLSSIKLWQGEYERALVLAEESVARFRALGLPEGKALGSLASKLFVTKGDLARAVSLAEQARALLDKIGERVYYPSVLRDLGAMRRRQGKLAEARALLEQSLVICKEQGSQHYVFLSQCHLARLLAEQGERASAEALYQENRAFLPLATFRSVVAFYLEGWGILKVALGLPATAARLWGAAEALREAIGIPMLPVERDEYAQAVTAARTKLSAAAFAAAWAEGRSLTPEQAVAAADQETLARLVGEPATRPPVAERLPEGLTPRELEVLRLVAKGLTNAQVAQALIITPRTVNAHLTAIYGKLGVTSRAGAIRYALEHQLG